MAVLGLGRFLTCEVPLYLVTKERLCEAHGFFCITQLNPPRTSSNLKPELKRRGNERSMFEGWRFLIFDSAAAVRFSINKNVTVRFSIRAFLGQ